MTFRAAPSFSRIAVFSDLTVSVRAIFGRCRVSAADVPRDPFVRIALRGAFVERYRGAVVNGGPPTLDICPIPWLSESDIEGTAAMLVVVVKDARLHRDLGFDGAAPRRLCRTPFLPLAWRLERELSRPGESGALAAHAAALQLLARVRTALRMPPEEHWLAGVRRVVESTGRRLTRVDMTSITGFSPAHVSRTFSHRYGVTITEYARLRRIETASDRLLHSHASVTEIASEVGFSDAAHFIRDFRVLRGITPAEYRRSVLSHGGGTP